MGVNNWNVRFSRRKAVLGLLGAGALQAAAAAEGGATTQKLKSGSSTLEIEISEGALDMSRAGIVDWLRKAMVAVATFYGHFPVAAAKYEIRIVEGRSSVMNGVTYGRSPMTMTRIAVGQHVTPEVLNKDWVAAHEMVHLGFPSVPRRSHWIEEGLATYVEPLARLHVKQISEDVFWRDMIRDMPQGLPDEGDRGLDNTHTWGRTYWGGAIYWILAEVEIRKRTSNRKGLQQALRGILKNAGSIQDDSEMEPVLTAGDKATGTTVLTDLYNQMKDQPHPVNLDELWRSLGVSWHDGGHVVYDDKAPLAATRRAIVTP